MTSFHSCPVNPTQLANSPALDLRQKFSTLTFFTHFHSNSFAVDPDPSKEKREESVHKILQPTLRQDDDGSVPVDAIILHKCINVRHVFWSKQGPGRTVGLSNFNSGTSYISMPCSPLDSIHLVCSVFHHTKLHYGGHQREDRSLGGRLHESKSACKISVVNLSLKVFTLRM